jgi:hypothetical protein
VADIDCGMPSSSKISKSSSPFFKPRLVKQIVSQLLSFFFKFQKHKNPEDAEGYINLREIKEFVSSLEAVVNVEDQGDSDYEVWNLLCRLLPDGLDYKGRQGIGIMCFTEFSKIL